MSKPSEATQSKPKNVKLSKDSAGGILGSVARKSRAYASTQLSSSSKMLVREAVPTTYDKKPIAEKKASHIDHDKFYLEQITGLATWVMGSTKAARAFMNHAHPMLGHVTPIEAIKSEEGKIAVHRILINIEFSLPA